MSIAMETKDEVTVLKCLRMATNAGVHLQLPLQSSSEQHSSFTKNATMKGHKMAYYVNRKRIVS
jgi:hypothetical protein